MLINDQEELVDETIELTGGLNSDQNAENITNRLRSKFSKERANTEIKFKLNLDNLEDPLWKASVEKALLKALDDLSKRCYKFFKTPDNFICSKIIVPFEVNVNQTFKEFDSDKNSDDPRKIISARNKLLEELDTAATQFMKSLALTSFEGEGTDAARNTDKILNLISCNNEDDFDHHDDIILLTSLGIPLLDKIDNDRKKVKFLPVLRTYSLSFDKLINSKISIWKTSAQKIIMSTLNTFADKLKNSDYKEDVFLFNDINGFINNIGGLYTNNLKQLKIVKKEKNQINASKVQFINIMAITIDNICKACLNNNASKKRIIIPLMDLKVKCEQDKKLL